MATAAYAGTGWRGWPERRADGRQKTEQSITERLITEAGGGEFCLGTSGEIQIGIYIG
jgi:hypothetical protein